LKDNLVANGKIRFFAWASLVSQILIVVTGGAVRLTGSGLGCPTWPECQPGSLTTVPELGIHGFIEFANRLLTFLLLIIALLTFIFILRSKGPKKGLVWTSFALGLGIIAQAVIGGITVLTGLNSWIVGSHFVVSVVLISIATILLWYAYGAKSVSVKGITKLVTLLLLPLGLLTILIGVVVTGAGPHAGDADTPRNGLDIELMSHLHSYPAYVTLGLVVLQIFLLYRNKSSVISSALLLATLLAQAIVGIAQTRLGLPIELVGIHMLGASVLASLITWQLLTRGIWFAKK
jgi:cytochrome c oxidase assembly protein subunit 15